MYICNFLLPVKNSPILKLKSLKSQHMFVKFDHAVHFSSFTAYYLVTKLTLPVNINNNALFLVPCSMPLLATLHTWQHCYVGQQCLIPVWNRHVPWKPFPCLVLRGRAFFAVLHCQNYSTVTGHSDFTTPKCAIYTHHRNVDLAAATGEAFPPCNQTDIPT